MSSFHKLSVELCEELVRYMSDKDIVALARTNRYIAVQLAEVVSKYPWRVSYSVYLCARYACGPAVFDTISMFPFLAYLSRACRCCGARTQRVVFGVLLCCKCTRNHRNRCWMLSTRAANQLGIYNIVYHSGARTKLVFAEHIEILSGLTRKDLRLYFGLPHVT